MGFISRSEGSLLKAFQNDCNKDFFIGIALSALLCMISIFTPVLGFFCYLLLPLPIIFYRIKLGRKPTGLIILSSLLLVAFASSDFAANIFFLLGIMGMGFFIGEGINNGLPVDKNILYSSGLILFVASCSLIIYGNLSNIGPIGVLSDYIGKNFELTLSLYKEMGMPEDSIRTLTEAQNEIRYILIRIIPALFSAGLLMTAWMNFLMARVILKRKNILIPTGAPLNTWKAPEMMVWGIIGSSAMLLIPVSLLQMIGLNGLIIFMTVYFFQGIAIISFYLEKKKIPVPLRVLFYGLIVIQQLIALIVIGLGFFDVWINFRRIGINNKNNQ
jgi:uncharacterized protein YybS (DUF2232 family)